MSYEPATKALRLGRYVLGNLSIFLSVVGRENECMILLRIQQHRLWTCFVLAVTSHPALEPNLANTGASGKRFFSLFPCTGNQTKVIFVALYSLIIAFWGPLGNCKKGKITASPMVLGVSWTGWSIGGPCVRHVLFLRRDHDRVRVIQAPRCTESPWSFTGIVGQLRRRQEVAFWVWAISLRVIVSFVIWVVSL